MDQDKIVSREEIGGDAGRAFAGYAANQDDRLWQGEYGGRSGAARWEVCSSDTPKNLTAIATVSRHEPKHASTPSADSTSRTVTETTRSQGTRSRTATQLDVVVQQYSSLISSPVDYSQAFIASYPARVSE